MRKTRFAMLAGLLGGLVCGPAGLLAQQPCGDGDIHRPPGTIEVDLTLVNGGLDGSPLPEWSQIEKLLNVYGKHTEKASSCSVLGTDKVGIRLFVGRADDVKADPTPTGFTADGFFQFYGSSRVKVERADRDVTRTFALPIAGPASIADVAEEEQLDLLLEDLAQLQLVAVPRFQAHNTNGSEICFLVSHVSAVPSRVFSEPLPTENGQSEAYLALKARRKALEYVAREARWLERVAMEESGCQSGGVSGYLDRQVRSLNLTVGQLLPEIDFVIQSVRFWSEVEQRIQQLRAEDAGWRKAIGHDVESSSQEATPTQLDERPPVEPKTGSGWKTPSRPIPPLRDTTPRQDLQTALRYYLKLRESLPEDTLILRKIHEIGNRLDSEESSPSYQEKVEYFRLVAANYLSAGDMESARPYLAKILNVAPHDEAAQTFRAELGSLSDSDSMLRFPGGEVSVGAPLGEAKYYNQSPRFRSKLPAFWIDKLPVSSASYKKFAGIPSSSNGADDFEPAVNVTFYEARDYCAGQGKRLPSEIEWEAGAGLEDFELADGISEWTASWYQHYPGNEWEEKEYGEKFRVIRGFDDNGNYDPRLRFFMVPFERAVDIGFRCAADSAPGRTAESVASSTP